MTAMEDFSGVFIGGNIDRWSVSDVILKLATDKNGHSPCVGEILIPDVCNISVVNNPYGSSTPDAGFNQYNLYLEISWDKKLGDSDIIAWLDAVNKALWDAGAKTETASFYEEQLFNSGTNAIKEN